MLIISHLQVAIEIAWVREKIDQAPLYKRRQLDECKPLLRNS